MKRSFSLTGWTVLAFLAGTACASANTCLDVRDIASSKPNDTGSAITFTMRNGAVWRNDLRGICPDLKFEGFEWVVRGPETVCENMQSLRVLHSGQVCELGKFTQITPAKKG